MEKVSVSQIPQLLLTDGVKNYGILSYKDTDFPWVICNFSPDPNFSEIKPLFDAELLAAEQRGGVDNWEDIYIEIEKLALKLRDTNNQFEITRFLLHIYGTEASFRF